MERFREVIKLIFHALEEMRINEGKSLCKNLEEGSIFIGDNFGVFIAKFLYNIFEDIDEMWGGISRRRYYHPEKRKEMAEKFVSKVWSDIDSLKASILNFAFKKEEKTAYALLEDMINAKNKIAVFNKYRK